MHNGILFRLQQEENPADRDNTDEAGGPYAQWTKTTEREILCGITDMWNQKKKKIEDIQTQK